MLQVDVLTKKLIAEIENFRGTTEATRLVEETFNPTQPRNCFLGQAFHGSVGTAEGYRDKIGRSHADLGRYRGDLMTPLEMWAAYYWDIDRELVMQVFRYIKGMTPVLPEIRYEEIQIVGQIDTAEESPE